jgi:hypothetical protein
MKDKILVWLDETITHFSIMKELQKREDVEIYAIIDTNKGRKFYEEQKIVNFSKIWFFRDCFDNLKSKPDTKYLKKIEIKYKINLWKIAYSDELIYGYNKFTKFSENEILKILETDCKFFEKVLDEVKPTFLFMKISDTCDMQILHQLCKSRNIKSLILGQTRLGSKHIISEDFDVLDEFKGDLEKDLENNFTTFEELRNFVYDYSKSHSNFIEKFRVSKIKWLKAGIKFIQLSSDKGYTEFYRNRSRSLWKVIMHSILFSVKRSWRSLFINSNFLKELNHKEPFIYFPLQLEPERTTQVSAPYYNNQVNMVNKIAKSIPIKYRLCVKEHPAQKAVGWRTISQYKEILKMPNIEFYHPSVSNELMIKNSSLVITMTGTSALEAAVNEKPSIIFANTNFSRISSILKLNNLEELPITIKKALKIKPKLSDFIDFFKIIESQSFDFPSREISREICNYFYYDGFLFDTEIPLSKMNLFLKENEIIFKKVADEHVKKMNKFKNYEKIV